MRKKIGIIAHINHLDLLFAQELVRRLPSHDVILIDPDQRSAEAIAAHEINLPDMGHGAHALVAPKFNIPQYMPIIEPKSRFIPGGGTERKKGAYSQRQSPRDWYRRRKQKRKTQKQSRKKNR